MKGIDEDGAVADSVFEEITEPLWVLLEKLQRVRWLYVLREQEDADVRMELADGGTIVLRESLSDFSCPGACVSQWPHGAPFSGTLTAEVVDGSGIFAGATGTLAGSLNVAAWEAQITYSGTITLA